MSLFRRPRPRLTDLPAVSGDRMTLAEVKGALHAPERNDSLRAIIQLLWLHRNTADDQARACAAANHGSRDYSLGGMQLVDNVLADLLRLADPDAPPSEEVKQWFRKTR